MYVSQMCFAGRPGKAIRHHFFGTRLAVSILQVMGDGALVCIASLIFGNAKEGGSGMPVAESAWCGEPSQLAGILCVSGRS